MSRKRLIKKRCHISCTLMTLILLLLCSGIATADASSEKEKQKPRLIDYLIVQSAGYLGFVAVGVGKNLGNHKVNILVGYVPENFGGVGLWQFNFKYDWHPSQAIPLGAPQENIRLDPFYIGLSVIYGVHDDLFVNLPPQYPAGYYPATARHYTLNIGASIQYSSHTFFLEYTALGVGLITYKRNPEYFLNNYDYLGLESIGSLAIGVKFEFQ